MKFSRFFFTEPFKGERGYFKTQRKYEIAKTLFYFAISISLFVAGWIATGSRLNLLTVVAVLGCLPAGKSTVNMIMFLRYSGCSKESQSEIADHVGSLQGLYDCIFTSYEKNYQVAHLVVKGDTICGFTEDPKFEEQAFYKHLESILKVDGFKNTSIKIFSELGKYIERLEQMNQLDTDESHTPGIIQTLKSVSL